MNGLKKPGLVLNAPEGLALVAEGELVMTGTKSLALSAGKEVDLSTAADLTLTAAKGISLFAKDSGATVAAATQDMIIQAQTDKLNIAAEQDLLLRTASGEIIISAEKEVVLACGGSYIKIKDGKIEFGCTGPITAKCATWILKGSDSLKLEMPILPVPSEPIGMFNQYFILKDEETGEPMVDVEYMIYKGDQTVGSGKTDEKGQTVLVYTEKSEELEFKISNIQPVSITKE